MSKVSMFGYQNVGQKIELKGDIKVSLHLN